MNKDLARRQWEETRLSETKFNTLATDNIASHPTVKKIRLILTEKDCHSTSEHKQTSSEVTIKGDMVPG